MWGRVWKESAGFTETGVGHSIPEDAATFGVWRWLGGAPEGMCSVDQCFLARLEPWWEGPQSQSQLDIPQEVHSREGDR